MQQSTPSAPACGGCAKFNKNQGRTTTDSTQTGGRNGSTLLWNVFGRKKPSKTNILKGVTAGVNLFAGGKALYLRELR